MNPKSILAGVVLIVALAVAAFRTLNAPSGDPSAKLVSSEQPVVAPPRPAPSPSVPPSEKKPSEGTTPTTRPESKPADTGSGTSSFFYAGRPVFDAENLTFLENVGYANGYSEVRQQPLWTCYHLKGEPAFKGLKRPDNIKFETDNRTRARVESRAYSNSGYDRGHNAPSDAIGAFFGEVAQRETFLMSNICPQKHDLNSGDWNGLENAEQFVYRRQYGEIWVVTGPLFEGQPGSMGTIGREKVPVPTSFYKIIVVEEKGRGQAGVKMLGVVMPQAAQGTHALRTYIVNVDTIEKRSGIDFFADLPDEIESRVEAAMPDASWELDMMLDYKSIRNRPRK
jgi:endonuclease G